MKKIFTAIVMMILVWGCTKKLAPANSGASSSPASLPAESNMGKSNEGTGAATAAQTPAENTGTFGAKVAPKPESAEEIAAITGQKLYSVKCNTCHGLKVTTDYTADRWASLLAVMAPRARLTDTERENVYAYVKANSKQ